MAFAFLHGLRTQDLKYTFSGGYAKIPVFGGAESPVTSFAAILTTSALILLFALIEDDTIYHLRQHG